MRRKTDSDNWGGARKGAGAPLKYGEPTKVINIRLPLSVLERVDQEPGSRAETIVEALKLYLN